MHALGECPHARAYLQSNVPTRRDEGLQSDFGLSVLYVVLMAGRRQQHQHVDIGVGKELASTISTHCQQGSAFGHGLQVPQRQQRAVDVFGQISNQTSGSRRSGSRLHEVRQ